MKILIADDDAIPRRFLQAALVKAGHEVVIARDGAEAWQILQRDNAPRLAILDWLMPTLDGVDVCRNVRQREDVPYTYLMLLTSKDQQEDIVAGLEAGADDYLVKPFDPQELEVRLRAGQRILDLQAALFASLEKLEQARQRETEIGARIQQTLLLGQPPGDLMGAQVATLTMASQAIDGDFYDFFQHSRQCLDLVIGDVMGKGVPAALLGAAIKSAFLRAQSHLLAASMPGTLPEPEAIVMRVHDDVTQRFIGLSVFATLCYARLDLARGQMVLVDCGHTKTLHIQRHTGRCTILQGDNMPLGFSEQEIYRQVVFPLSGGDILIFYSDGVTEARNTAGEFFGVDRLIEVIQAKHHLQPQGLIDAIHTAIRAFTQVETSADDLTCIAVSLAETGDVLVPVPSDRSAASSEHGEANLLAHAWTEITSAMAELPLLRAFVRTFCQDLPVLVLDEDSLGQLELAVTEAASNIMKHAYHGRTDRRIQVTADAFPDRIVIRLSHGGMAFDPKTVKPPALDGSRESGFGVYIIAHAVDEVHYVHGEAGGHGIRLVKKRKNPMNRGRSYGADV